MIITSATIQKGDKIALIGKNGSGKSSLLNILNGTDEDFEGQIVLDGLVLDHLWGRFGMILQQEHTFISSYENNVTLFNSSMKNSEKKILKKFHHNPCQVVSNNGLLSRVVLPWSQMFCSLMSQLQL